MTSFKMAGTLKYFNFRRSQGTTFYSTEAPSGFWSGFRRNDRHTFYLWSILQGVLQKGKVMRRLQEAVRCGHPPRLTNQAVCVFSFGISASGYFSLGSKGRRILDLCLRTLDTSVFLNFVLFSSLTVPEGERVEVTSLLRPPWSNAIRLTESCQGTEQNSPTWAVHADQRNDYRGATVLLCLSY